MCTSKVSGLLDAQNGLHFTPWQMRGWQCIGKYGKMVDEDRGKFSLATKAIQLLCGQKRAWFSNNNAALLVLELGHCVCNALKRNYLGRKLLFQKHKASTDIEIMHCMTYEIITCNAAASAKGAAS